MPSVHYLLKIKIKENVSNRDYIHIYIQIYRNYAINYFYYVRKIRLISHHRAFTNNVTFPLAAQIFSSPLFTRARLPTSFLNRLICIPGTCVSRHNMQMSRPPPVSLPLSAISRYRASIFVKTSTYFAHPAPPFFLLPLFIIIFALRFHSINLFRFLYCARNPTRILLLLSFERNWIDLKI